MVSLIKIFLQYTYIVIKYKYSERIEILDKKFDFDDFIRNGGDYAPERANKRHELYGKTKLIWIKQ